MAIAQDPNFQEKQTDAEQRFEAFMQSELVPAAEALESQRLAQRSKLVKQAWGFGILVAASIPLSMQMQSYAWTIGLGIVSALVLGITYSRSAKLNRQFKTGIAPLLVSRVCGADARYMPYEGIPLSDFELAGLWSRKPDRYKASDGISGKRGKNWYRFSEVVAEYEAETRVRHGNSYSMETERHAIFTGVLFQTDFKKALTGRLIIKRQGHDENIDLPRVALDDETFAQRFEVYATDSAQAQSILSQVFMDKLLQLDRKFQNNLEFSFINGMIYVAHSTPDDRLESSMWTSYLDQESVRSTMVYLEQWVSVVDLLDLNGL
ncbi:MAG: DUF3137 domain-containing protein [Bacteroidota bacterium]